MVNIGELLLECRIECELRQSDFVEVLLERDKQMDADTFNQQVNTMKKHYDKLGYSVEVGSRSKDIQNADYFLVFRRIKEGEKTNVR